MYGNALFSTAKSRFEADLGDLATLENPGGLEPGLLTKLSHTQEKSGKGPMGSVCNKDFL